MENFLLSKKLNSQENVSLSRGVFEYLVQFATPNLFILAVVWCLYNTKMFMLEREQYLQMGLPDPIEIIFLGQTKQLKFKIEIYRCSQRNFLTFQNFLGINFQNHFNLNLIYLIFNEFPSNFVLSHIWMAWLN